VIREANTAETGALCANQNYKQEIVAHACSCIFIKFQNKIYPRPGLESSPDAAVQWYVLADNRWRNVRLRHSVSWCSSQQVLIYCHEHCSQLISRDHPDIEILWAVMNGDRIATEDTNCEVSEKDPGLLEQFSACIQASVMSWTADRYNKSLIQHFLSLEEAELRPANPREWTVSVAGRSGAPAGNLSWRNISKTTRPAV